jgi:gamma-glutamyltranspeptidase/glutathione hydrolase
VTEFAGTTVHECAPNGQGLVALIALNIVGEFASLSSAQRTHVMVEALRLAFADARQYIGGSSDSNTIRALLSPQYARERARLISLERAAPTHPAGRPIAASDTVYLCAGDKDGNCCSFINSNYMGFGTGIPVAGKQATRRPFFFFFFFLNGFPQRIFPSKPRSQLLVHRRQDASQCSCWWKASVPHNHSR